MNAQRPSPEPRGLVGQPRLQTFSGSPARDARFLFQGRVDFPGSSGHVRIDVLNDGNGDANDALNWTIDVARGVIDATPTVIDGEDWFFWSTLEPIAIFQDMDPTQERWPEGGTARMRFVAVRNNSNGSESHTVLDVLDRQGIRGFSTDLIVADSDPRPTSRGITNNPDYLNKKPALGRDDTARYYSTVGTSSTGRGSSIAGSLRSLEAFRRRYSFPIFTDANIEHAGAGGVIYFNRGDLGIGRNMQCTFHRRTMETACFVRNFGRRDGTPLFGNLAETRAAIEANKPFATVAMVERGLMRSDAPNKVFFVVYDNKGQLALEAQLDNKGFNKSIPGNCLVCHGAAGSFQRARAARCPPPLPPDLPICNAAAAEVRGAYFLPFDVSSFRFYDSVSRNDGFRVPIDVRRRTLEPAFKRLNEFVLRTDLRHLSHAAELVEGWYGGPGMPSSTFNDEFVPQGWNQDANTRKLYRTVVAETCRSCHISHSILTFGTLEQFSLFKTPIRFDICQAYTMPNAEQTQDIFWRSSARPHLLNRLPIQFGCGFTPLPRRGRTPVAGQDLSTVRRAFEDYKAHSCACTTKSCLEAVEERYGEVIATLGPIDSSDREHIDSLLSEAIACRQWALAPVAH